MKNFNFFPVQASVLAPKVDALYFYLIAVSVFQGGEGSIRYRGIVLEDGDGRAVVHP